MGREIKEFVGNVISNIIANKICGFLVGFGAPWALLWSTVKGYIAHAETGVVPKGYLIIYIIGLIISVICIVVNVFAIAKRANKPKFPKIQSDVRYESAKSELYFKSREEVLCTREVHFEIVCDKKDAIEKQFSWTGTEYKGTELEASAENYTLVDHNRIKPPHGYAVKFNTTKRRGDKVWYKTRTKVGDANHEMQPFLSHMIKSPTDELEIRVTAPKRLLKDVTFIICADNMGEIPISEPELIPVQVIGDLETFSKKIKKPNLLYSYRLEWKF